MTDEKTAEEQIITYANNFNKQVLDELPDVESICITFCFTTDKYSSFAVMGGQDGPVAQPAELMHMARQLSKTQEFIANAINNQVQKIDNYMQEQANQLTELTNELSRTQQKLAETQAEVNKIT